MHPSSSCKTELLNCAVRAMTGLNTSDQDEGMPARGHRGAGIPPVTAPGCPCSPAELMVEPDHGHRGPLTTLQMPYLSLHREQISRLPMDRVGDASL